MVSKILAAGLAVAVLSVGGYTYWNYAGGHCCPAQAAANALTAGEPADSAAQPCCQEPSRTSCFTLPAGEGCCEDLPATAPAREVLDIPPRELK